MIARPALEQLRMIQKDPGGYPPLLPVVNALDAMGQLEAEKTGNDGRAAYRLNQLPVIRGVDGFGFHAPIKHRVYRKVNVVCINNTCIPATILR